MALAPGTVAPDFTLRSMSSAGLVDVTLSQHLGKDVVVLLFVPGAFTPVCTKELCDVSGGLSAYSDLGAVVYGISNDTPFAQTAWAKSSGIAFPLLSDFEHKAAQAFDVVWADFAGLGAGTARAVFVIGKDGVVKYAEQTPTLGDMPDFDKLHAALRDVANA